VVGDDVEIGPNSTIDRATFGETRIGRGCKLDSKVHVGHNVELGEYVMMCGMSGIAGSAKLGSHIILGGQSGVVGHIEVGDGVRLGAQSMLSKTTRDAGDYAGIPAAPLREWLRQAAAGRQLPELVKRVAKLEALIEKLGK